METKSSQKVGQLYGHTMFETLPVLDIAAIDTWTGNDLTQINISSDKVIALQQKVHFTNKSFICYKARLCMIHSPIP